MTCASNHHAVGCDTGSSPKASFKGIGEGEQEVGGGVGGSLRMLEISVGFQHVLSV